MDEEKESLRRQIQLLQGLINSHKTIHGNAPAPQPAANPRWPTPAQPHGDLRGADYRQPNQSGWRKKYSLVNRTSQGADACGGPTGDAQKAIDVSQKQARPKLSGNKVVSAFKWQSAATQQSRASANAAAPSTSVLTGVRPLHSRGHGAAQTQEAHKEGPRGARPLYSGGHVAHKEVLRGAKPFHAGGHVAHKEVLRGAQPLHSGGHVAHKEILRGAQPLRSGGHVAHKEVLRVAQPLHLVGHGAAKTQGAHKEELRGARPLHSAGHGATLTQGAHKGVLKGASEAAQKMSWTSANKTTPAQVPVATQTPFKKPLVAVPRTEGNCAPLKPAFSYRTLLVPSSPQKRNETVTATKTSKGRKTKYIWVADSPKAPPVCKKVSPTAKKTASDGKQKPPEVTAAVRGRKNGASPKVTALKSRYKWKAENVSSREAPVTPSHSSAVHRGAPKPGPLTPQQSKAVMAAAASYRDSAQSGYKVKSKMKIVRRRSTSRSPVDKKSSPLAPLMVKSHYFLRRRSSPRVKSTCTVRRSSPRGLVHLSKHRLRRLPPPGKQQHPTPSREAAASSLKSSASSRVIKTRYRIVKRSGTPPLVTSPLSTLSSSLNWRTRLLMLNRLRQNQNQQRWRSRGLCFIGGAMYRVSANKLSKTWSPGSGSSATAKTGKLDVSSTSPGPLYPSRSATPSRYIASRAVQRSLAIIRHAQQKKERKEYCMYYNRFGKCNRGQKCPYIHDPEKVAVCTRFLRGTCKKTDGSCPFSHQVSKDKMPVCSYFLKGICRNNDCPYSHVYVSRKAEVCQDFLKGYCPMGAKCKKKHTLLCPDYARDGKCPQGSKCKLQHRQRKRRLEVTAQPELTSSSAKQRRKVTDRPGTSPATTRAYDNPSASDEELPGSSGLRSCLSFISLNCSSASEGTPVSERVKSTENSGKPLQIKPRL